MGAGDKAAVCLYRSPQKYNRMNADESNEFKKVRAFASLPRTVRGFPTVIGSSPKGDKIIYCNGNSVSSSSLTNVDIYTEHPVPTTVAKMSPSGFYIASGDSAGNVRIWDTTQSTHILKAAYQVFSGSVRDIAWNDDSKRIAAVGEGRERFGHVFLFDTGTSNGNLSGQSRPMSSIDFRPTRPYRLVSGSEDNTVAIFEGPPFKFKTAVRSTQEDAVSVWHGSTCGNDRQTEPSGDKTSENWKSAEEKRLEKVVTFGDSTEDQQIGISWSTKALVSVSLAGFLSFIDPAGNITLCSWVHNKGITSASPYFYCQARWNVSNGESIRIQPTLHRSQIVGLVVGRDEVLISCAWDDTVRFTSGATSSDPVHSKCVKLPSQPQGMASSYDGNLTVIACYKNVLVFEDDKLSADLNVTFNPSCAAIFGDLVAVGGQDSKVHIFSFSGGALQEKTTLPHSSPITRVVPYSVEDFKTVASKEWTFHTSTLAKVNCVAWSPDNRHLATGGLDTNIIIWDLERSGEHPIIIRGAHAMSPVNGLVFLNSDELLSVGQDANVKHWKINL
ncbi:WD domain, G-beta repeat protein, partial [Ostertagia ostertagi]